MSDITGNNALVTKSALKSIIDNCKLSFQTAGVPFIGTTTILKITFTNTDWSKMFLHLEAYATDHIDTLISIYNTFNNSAVLNLSVGKIQSIHITNDASTLYIAADKILSTGHISIQTYDTENQVIYKPILTIESVTSTDNVGAIGTVYNLMQEETKFSITDADGDIVDYTSEISFNSIEIAGKLNREKTFTVSLDELEIKSTDLSDDTIYVDGNPIIDYITNTPQIFPIATKSNLGVVQIGDGLEISNGLLSCNGAKPATETTCGTIKVGFQEQNKSKAVKLDTYGNAYVDIEGLDIHRFDTLTDEHDAINHRGLIIQYIGESDENYTQGYFYKSIPEWKVTKDVNDIYFSLSVSQAVLGNRFASYFSGRIWDNTSQPIQGELIDSMTLSYNDGWKFSSGDYTYAIDESDIQTYLGIKLPANEDNSTDTSRSVTFTIQARDTNCKWTRINVQPVSFIGNQDSEIITDADIDEVIAEQVTGIQLYDAQGNIIEDMSWVTLTGTSSPYLCCTVQAIPWDADITNFTYTSDQQTDLGLYRANNKLYVTTIVEGKIVVSYGNFSRVFNISANTL